MHDLEIQQLSFCGVDPRVWVIPWEMIHMWWIHLVDNGNRYTEGPNSLPLLNRASHLCHHSESDRRLFRVRPYGASHREWREAEDYCQSQV